MGAEVIGPHEVFQLRHGERRLGVAARSAHCFGLGVVGSLRSMFGAPRLITTVGGDFDSVVGPPPNLPPARTVGGWFRSSNDVHTW